MPLVKVWNAEKAIKKIGNVKTHDDVIAVALEKGVCIAENVKVSLYSILMNFHMPLLVDKILICALCSKQVFLQDGTEVDNDIFAELLGELPLDQRIFIVSEDSLPVMPSDTAPSKFSFFISCQEHSIYYFHDYQLS